MHFPSSAAHCHHSTSFVPMRSVWRSWVNELEPAYGRPPVVHLQPPESWLRCRLGAGRSSTSKISPLSLRPPGHKVTTSHDYTVQHDATMCDAMRYVTQRHVTIICCITLRCITLGYTMPRSGCAVCSVFHVVLDIGPRLLSFKLIKGM